MELGAANTLFSEKYLARAEETDAASPENIRSKRNKANEAWYTTRVRVNAYHPLLKMASNPRELP